MSPSYSLIRKKDLAGYGIPLSSSAIYQRASEGTFPRPIKIGVRASAWRSDHLDVWKANPTGYRVAGA